jgi:hypothetical protein
VSDLEDLWARVDEDRAVLAVLMHLATTERRRIGAITRPEREHPSDPRRKPDAVAEVDGEPIAVEVVRWGPPADETRALARLHGLEARLRRMVLARLDVDILPCGVLVGLSYVPGALATVDRPVMRRDEARLADAISEAVRTGRPGSELEPGVAWIGDAWTTLVPDKRSLHISTSVGSTEDPEGWLEWAVAKKGDQHAGWADRAILAVVPAGGGDSAALGDAARRWPGVLPWWRVYTVRLDGHALEMVRESPPADR